MKALDLRACTVNRFKTYSFPTTFTKHIISVRSIKARSGREAEKAMVFIAVGIKEKETVKDKFPEKGTEHLDSKWIVCSVK